MFAWPACRMPTVQQAQYTRRIIGIYTHTLLNKAGVTHMLSTLLSLAHTSSVSEVLFHWDMYGRRSIENVTPHSVHSAQTFLAVNWYPFCSASYIILQSFYTYNKSYFIAYRSQCMEVSHKQAENRLYAATHDSKTFVYYNTCVYSSWHFSINTILG